MESLKKFSTQHLNTLCSKGISCLLGLSLILSVIHNAIILSTGVIEPFNESEFSNTIFNQRLLILSIISIAFVLQIIHLIKPQHVLISRIVVVLLLVSFAFSLNLVQTVKKLSINNNNTENTLSQCEQNQYKLWPDNSQEMYNQAQSLDCQGNCPCSNQSVQPNPLTKSQQNYQMCILQNNFDVIELNSYGYNLQNSGSNLNNLNTSPKNIDSTTNTLNVSESNTSQVNQNNSEQQSQNNTKQSPQNMIETLKKLSQIEETLQCSGICIPQQKYFFYKITEDISSDQQQTSCYQKAVDLIYTDILIHTKKQSIMIIFIFIISLLQVIFISKSEIIIQFAKNKLGACLILPITSTSQSQESTLLSSNNNSQQDNSIDKKHNNNNNNNNNISPTTANKAMKIYLIDVRRKNQTIKSQTVKTNNENKIPLELKVSPQLLRTNDSNSPTYINEAQTPVQLLQNNKISIEQETN